MQSRMSNTRSPRLLPLIPGRNGGSGPSSASSFNTQPADDGGSRYHRGCAPKRSIYLDWSSKTDGTVKGRGISSGKSRSLASFKDAEERDIIHYLNKHKDFLDAYVNECIPLEIAEKWVLKKQIANVSNPSVSSKRQQTSCRQKSKISKKEMYMDLLQTLQSDTDEHSIMWQLARSIVASVGVDAFRVYKLFPDHPGFLQYFVFDQRSQETPKVLQRAEVSQVSQILEVAKRRCCVRLCRTQDPGRVPDSQALLKSFGIRYVKQANHVMYQPILSRTGKTSYLLEMWRVKDKFLDVDEEISSNFLVWGSLSLHYCNLYMDKKRERTMSDFLLDVVKAIFEEMVSLDQLIKTILEFAQKLVNADRASLFLVDYRNFELVSTVFDLKFEPGQDRDMEKKEIRMPINRGIAGHVALSGETMNIPDAYSDYRFNREVDEATGYKTISILCMPIKVEGRVIGVVQMVNKRNDNNFGHEDEVSFEIFSTFFGLALHHARLYDRIMRKEQKYRVALEVLSYHNTCRENEVQTMLSDKENTNVDLNDFYLDPFKFNEFEKCKCVITMFRDLFGLANFDIMTLTRFVLTVKKNYRTVPYHNFDHGWSVAHAMYVMLKNDTKKRFNYKMRLALFVASLCHDLDHRGYTNKYMSETASPLAAMYTTSTLEHHHFNITVTILHQDGHNVFSHISSEEFKEVLSFIRQSILATDLAAFFPNLEKMKQLHNENASPGFNWSTPSHRDLAMAISMTAADLSASAKPWDIQIKTVKVIFEEFYDQGDKERAAGRTPIPMMDRSKPDEQPASQVGFLSQICLPCYKMLYKILPNTKPMFGMASKNLDRWQARANRILRKIERKGNPQDSNDEMYSDSDEEDDIGLLIVDKEIELSPDVSTDKDEGTLDEASGFDVTLDETTEVEAAGLAKDEKGSKAMEIKRNSVWDEEDDSIDERFSLGIWKHMDGSWIDEEGVVVAKRASPSVRGTSARDSVNEEKNKN